MKTKIRVCKWEKFNDIIEDRINKISINEFITHLNYTHNNIYLYKKIYNPNFTFGYFQKKYKNVVDNYLDFTLKENTDASYPKKNFSLVCSTREEDEIGTTFLVFPFKESLFTIKEGEDYFKGFWKDKIKWLEKFEENELWTENDCILVKKSIWDKVKLAYNLK
jgi:hypothetical protein